MTLDDFRQSLTATEPPFGLTHALAGLWRDAKGDWKRAPEIFGDHRHRPSAVLIRSRMLTVVFAIPSNTRFLGHSLDFRDKFWDKPFGRLKPFWMQQLSKVW